MGPSDTRNFPGAAQKLKLGSHPSCVVAATSREACCWAVESDVFYELQDHAGENQNRGFKFQIQSKIKHHGPLVSFYTHYIPYTK